MKRDQPVQNRCPYCGDYYTPYIRAAGTQKTCGKAACRRKHKQEIQKSWVSRNPGCFRGRYVKVKAWLAAHPGYLRLYRAAHPDYVARDDRARVERWRKHRRFRSDIQDGLLRRKITKIRAISYSDIQVGLRLKLDGILDLMSG